MKYTIQAVKRGKRGASDKTKGMPLNHLNDTILNSYFSDPTRNSDDYFLKWRASAEQICQNVGLDCDQMFLEESKKGQKLNSYQIINVFINIDKSGPMITLEMKKAHIELSEERGLFYLLVTYKQENGIGKEAAYKKGAEHLTFSLTKPGYLL